MSRLARGKEPAPLGQIADLLEQPRTAAEGWAELVATHPLHPTGFVRLAVCVVRKQLAHALHNRPQLCCFVRAHVQQVLLRQRIVFFWVVSTLFAIKQVLAAECLLSSKQSLSEVLVEVRLCFGCGLLAARPVLDVGFAVERPAEVAIKRTLAQTHLRCFLGAAPHLFCARVSHVVVAGVVVAGVVDADVVAAVFAKRSALATRRLGLQMVLVWCEWCEWCE